MSTPNNHDSMASMGESFMGTIHQQMDSSHISIVDETSDRNISQRLGESLFEDSADMADMDDFELAPPSRPSFELRATKPKSLARSVSAGNPANNNNNRSSRRGATPPRRRGRSPNGRSASPTRTHSRSGSPTRKGMARRSLSPPRGAHMVDRSSQSAAMGGSSRRMIDQSMEGSSRRMMNSTRSFGYGEGSDAGSQLLDFDDEGSDFNMGKDDPAPRPSFSTTTSTGRNLWEASRDTIVDQTLNLTDHETGQYEKRMSKRGVFAKKARQKSLVDIFLHDDSATGNNDNRSSFGTTFSSLHSKDGNGGRRVKWTLLFSFLCALLAFLLFVPPFGLVYGPSSGGGNKDNKTTNTPKPSSSPIVSPTKSPTNPPSQAVTKEEKEQKEEGVVVDTEEERGGEGINLMDFLQPKDRPEEVISPVPENGATSPVTAVSFASILGFEEDEGMKNVDAIPTESRKQALKFIILDQDVSAHQYFDDSKSAQRRALKWISETDAAKLKIPGIDNVEDPVEATHQLLQRYALAVLYYAQDVPEEEKGYRRLGSDKNSRRQTFEAEWLKHTSVCKWAGVTCNEDALVTAIDLSDCQLKGTLPREIMVGGALPFLTALDLSHNGLVGDLPHLYDTDDHIGELMQPPANALNFLYLQDNSIHGTIDPLVNLDQLIYVDLSANELTGPITAEFCSALSQLDTLLLSNNHLQGNLPAELGGLTQLVRLRLNGNLFAGPVPARWAALRVLETLDLSHCKGIEGEIPSAFASMSEMKYLKLHNTNLEGPIPGFLGKLKKLKELHLYHTNLEGDMPLEVCSLRSQKDGLKVLTSDCVSTVSCNSDCCTECFS